MDANSIRLPIFFIFSKGLFMSRACVEKEIFSRAEVFFLLVNLLDSVGFEDPFCPESNEPIASDYMRHSSFCRREIVLNGSD